MSIEREFVVFAVLLVALAANPVWFFPHLDDDDVRNYQAVEVTDENQYRLVERHPEVLECRFSFKRKCAFEHAVLDGEVVLNSSHVDTAEAFDYDYVILSGGFYEPTMESTGDELHLTLESRSTDEVLRGVSYPYADSTEQTRKVVRERNATVDWPIPDRDRIVRRDGTYYALRDVDRDRRPLGGWVPRYRWAMWLGTVPLSFAAMWRWT